MVKKTRSELKRETSIKDDSGIESVSLFREKLTPIPLGPRDRTPGKNHQRIDDRNTKVTIS